MYTELKRKQIELERERETITRQINKLRTKALLAKYDELKHGKSYIRTIPAERADIVIM